MSLLHIILLALIQGITEFLPISSSGHLILLPALTGWEDQGQLIDIAVHMGSLVALIAYFWRDVLNLFSGVFKLGKGQTDNKETQFLLQLVVATIPAVLIGFLMHKFVGEIRSVQVVATTAIVFALVMYAADKIGTTSQTLEDMTYKRALILGFAQCIALIPGTSRSGITMTAARFMGFQRREAARFSMLMSIPTILGAFTLASLDIYKLGNVQLTHDALLTSAFTAIFAFGAVTFLMRWLVSHTLTVFVVYRLLLGAGLWAWILMK
jgi:undecaprenyl-diphosphatase